MNVTKPRVIQDFYKLPENLQEQVKLVYPEGFSEYLIDFYNAKGELISALRFETDEKLYLLRMTRVYAKQIIEDDSDYNALGILRDDIREEYEERHGDEEYLLENENYSREEY